MNTSGILLGEIAEDIIKKVQTESALSGFQCIIDYSYIEAKYVLKLGETAINQIVDELRTHKEVADVQLDPDGGFDVVLYTDYAPNYVSPEEDPNYYSAE